MYLYWRDDQDLIALKASYGKEFLNTVRECLTAYLCGKPYSFHKLWGLAQSYNNETVTLSFSDERDAGIVEFLKQQPKGQQSNTVKYILRAYMDGFQDGNYMAKRMENSHVELKLSTGHDADLLCLYYYNPDMFQKWMLDAVRAYVKKTPYTFQVPDDWSPLEGKEIRSKQVTISFSPDDKEVVEYLDGVKDGLRDSILKNIFRASFDRPLLCAGMELKLLADRKRAVKKGDGDVGKEPAGNGKVFPVPKKGAEIPSKPSFGNAQGQQPVQQLVQQAYQPDYQPPVQEAAPYQYRKPENRQAAGGGAPAGDAPMRTWSDFMQQHGAPSQAATQPQPSMQPAQTGYHAAYAEEPEEEFDMDMFDELGR